MIEQTTNTTNNESARELAQAVATLLDSKKGEDIEVIDVANKGYLSQFVVVATAMAGKHALSLLHYMKEELKGNGVQFYAVDEENEDWIIIDLGEVIVHIFTENHRKKYNIEEFLLKTFVKPQPTNTDDE